MMTKVVLCLACGAATKRHCKDPGCPWVDCETHGRVRLTATQRKALGNG